jgi:hypothetical protein
MLGSCLYTELDEPSHSPKFEWPDNTFKHTNVKQLG